MGQRTSSIRMISRRSSGTGYRWVVPGSLAIAILLTVLPYPDWMRFAVPNWVTLVLFYWCIATPKKVGVGTGWITGILVDLLLHTLFGLHAVTKAFVAMIAVTAHRRLRMYHLWQQCIIVFIISAVEISFVNWVFHLTNDVAMRLIFWQSALTSALVWPVVYTILRYARQQSGITESR